jgi:hypothetical protein
MSGRQESLRVLCSPGSPRVPEDPRYPWEHLADGADIPLASRVARVRIALMYFGNHWFPTVSAVLGSPYGRFVERLIEFLPVLDGVVFVADSQPERTEAGLAALELLLEFMRERGLDPAQVPFVFQLNKRDLPNVLHVEELRTILSTPRCAHVESIAVRQRGVHQALETLLRLVDSATPP